MSRKRVSPEQVVEALRQAGGNKRQAAQLLDVSLSTLYQCVHRYPMVQKECAALDQARQKGQLPCIPRGRPEHYGPQKVADALRRSGGIKSHAATLLGCTRQTIDNYTKRYPEVREMWIEARETIVDTAQSKLYDAVERGEWKAVRFTLVTLGKDRGFTTRPRPTPKGSAAAEYERRQAEFEADLQRAYGKDEEDCPVCQPD